LLASYTEQANSIGSHMQEKTVVEKNGRLFERMSAALSGSTHPYAQKDLQKAKCATKFIGVGSQASSTNRYRLAAGDLANCGQYVSSDVVFISAEGARRGRISVDVTELRNAAAAGVTFVTDNVHDRNRSYNVGEREVANCLLACGYVDNDTGRWQRTPH
jgi:hypothetical protein